jgi:hypothetical protein
VAAKIAQIADAVVTLLNAVPIVLDSEAITAQKRYLPPRYDASELDSPTLVVVPMPDVEYTTETRATDRRTYTIGVGLLLRLDDATAIAPVEDLLEVAEGIAVQLAADGKRVLTLADGSKASLITKSIEAIFDPRALDQFNVFFALINPTYAIIA